MVKAHIVTDSRKAAGLRHLGKGHDIWMHGL